MPLGAFKAALMGTAGVSTGDVVLLSSQTASGSATIEFTSGIDSTYGEYIFACYNVHPASDGQWFGMQFDAVGASGYNETITSTTWVAQHNEADDNANINYTSSKDQAQGTAYQGIGGGVGNDADQAGVYKIHLFNPASTTYVKHFYTTCQIAQADDYSMNYRAAGYINTTTAIDSISFKFDSGNIDVGTFKMWGVK